MYNLKNVYAVISFERNKINLLVVENAPNGKVNYLYFNNFEHDYLDENVIFINYEHLLDKLKILIRNADNFLGINIRRYIVNISCLPIKSIQGHYPESLVFETLSEKHERNYVNKLTVSKRDEKQYTLRIYPTTWYLDGQSFPNFPKGSHGKKISFDYVGIVSERRIVDQFVDLLKEIGGNVLEITCNSLCLGVCAINNGSDAVVVDIKTTSTIINLYNKAGDIKSITTLNKGSRWYYDEVKKIFGVNEKTDILPTINALNTIKNVNPNTVLLYKHGNEFLTIQDADTQSFVIALKIITNKLFKDISSALSELQIKCHANFNKIYLNVIESLQLVFKDVCPHSILENLPIEMLTNTIVGLEDYAVNDMLLATTYVHNLQSANNSYIYSIDPFISDKAENYQLKQNLWTRLGIISTRWAAKLGE